MGREGGLSWNEPPEAFYNTFPLLGETPTPYLTVISKYPNDPPPYSPNGEGKPPLGVRGGRTFMALSLGYGDCDICQKPWFMA